MHPNYVAGLEALLADAPTRVGVLTAPFAWVEAAG